MQLLVLDLRLKPAQQPGQKK